MGDPLLTTADYTIFSVSCRYRGDIVFKSEVRSFANFASFFACGAHFDPGRRTSWRRELHLELHQDTVDLPLRSPQFNKEKEESHR